MPVPAAIAAALIGGGTQVASNLIQNSGSRRSQNRANRHNIRFWEMQNAYNDPSAQMARLKAAGLNPNMIYGTSPTSAVGNADKIAPSKAPEYKFDNPLQGIQSHQNIAQTSAQTDNLKSQNTVLAQEAILKAAQTGKTLSEGASAATKAAVDKALLSTSVEASKENLRTLEQNTIGRELDNAFKSGALKDQLKRIFYEARNANEALKGSKLQNAMKQLELQLFKVGIQKNDPWYFRILGRANIEKLNSRINPKIRKSTVKQPFKQ